MLSLVKKYKQVPIQIKASIWFLVCSFLQKGIMVITTPIFTRIMSTEEYGRFGVFNSWMSIISVFVTLNLYSGMYTRGLVKYENDRNVFSSSIQGLVLLLSTCWLLLYLAFQNIINSFSSLSTTQMLLMFILIWTSSAFNFWASEQRVELHYKALVAVTLAVSLLKPILGVILVLNLEDKVTARIIGLVIIEILFFTWCFISQLIRGKRLYNKMYWKEALVFNLPLVPHYLSMSILNGADKIMIERMIDSSEAGIYNLAYQISQVMMLFNIALTQTIEPWLYKKIKDGNTSEIKRVAYPSWAFIALMNILLVILAPDIVAIFAPRGYYDAIWVIPPIAMSVYFIFLYAFFAVFEFYYAKTKLAAVATCTGAVLNIGLNLLFIRLFGYYAAGYTTLFCYIVYAFMHYLFMKNICDNQGYKQPVYDVRYLFLLSMVFVILSFLSMITYNRPIIRYCVLAFIVLVALLKRKVLIDFGINLLSKRKEK